MNLKRSVHGVVAVVGLVAILSAAAIAADAPIRTAVYTRPITGPAPTASLDLPMQIPSTLDLPMQIKNTPVTSVGWRHHAYRYYYPYGPAVVYRPYVYAPVVPYRPYYSAYPPYGAVYYRGPYYGHRYAW